MASPAVQPSPAYRPLERVPLSLLTVVVNRGKYDRYAQLAQHLQYELAQRKAEKRSN